jgi:hypothetical protein
MKYTAVPLNLSDADAPAAVVKLEVILNRSVIYGRP